MQSNSSFIETIAIAALSGVFIAGIASIFRQAYPGKSSPAELTRLMEVAAEGDVEHAKVLLSLDDDINEQDNTGGTALHYAVRNKHLEMAIFLLDAGASPFLKTKKDGLTALAIAKKMEWEDGVALLETRMATMLKESRREQL